MVVFVLRRRVLFCVSLCCVSLFFVSLLSTGDILSAEQASRKTSPVLDDARLFLRGENASKEGVVVQLWPRNSLGIIRNAFRISNEKQNEGHALEESTILAPKQPPVPESPVPISEELVPCGKRNDECYRFRKLLETWPKGKPHAAFYFLTQPRRLVMLQRALKSVETYFNNNFHYPIIIFHEANLIPYIPKIRSYTSSDLFFQEIVFSIPDFLTAPVREDIPCYSHIGYRHMCRFHAKGVFEQPIIRGLDYYWRLDDDSLLLREVSYDVFQFMQENKLLYGYSWQHVDSAICTKGLWNATREYIDKTSIDSGFFEQWTEPRLYYNNFEISAMRVWLSKAYADYVEYLDKLGGMYYHRWGDAPIKGIAVSLFVPKSQIHRFSDIGYRHGSYVNK